MVGAQRRREHGRIHGSEDRRPSPDRSHGRGTARDRNINVNCVLPTTLDTPENRAAMPDADPARFVAPADLAQVIVFLASPAARAIHGAALPVTGRA